MKIAVTGGRDYQDRAFVYEALDSFIEWYDIDFIGVGCAQGLDLFVRNYCEEFDVDHKVFYADWDRLGHSAGKIRNGEILDVVKPALLLSWPGGPGTADMISQAKKRKIRHIEVASINRLNF